MGYARMTVARLTATSEPEKIRDTGCFWAPGSWSATHAFAHLAGRDLQSPYCDRVFHAQALFVSSNAYLDH